MATIAQLNDDHRRTFPANAGTTVLTVGVSALPEADKVAVLKAVKDFNTFTKDNDPYGEHDFGKVSVNGHNVFWKIDYYDRAMKYASPDPTDPAVTRRVLTIMLTEEY